MFMFFSNKKSFYFSKYEKDRNFLNEEQCFLPLPYIKIVNILVFVLQVFYFSYMYMCLHFLK